MSLPGLLRRPILAALLALSMLGMLFTIFWLWAEHRLQVELDGFVRAREADGWVIRRGASTHGGWPFWAVLDTSDVSASGGEGVVRGGLRWDAPKLRLSIPTVFYHQWVSVTVPDEQRWRFPLAPSVTWTASSMKMMVEADGTWNHVLDLSGIVASAPARYKVHVETLTLNVEKLFVPPFTFWVSASGVDLPQGGFWPHGPFLRSFEVHGWIEGPIPGAGDTLKTWATRWRDAGGMEYFNIVDCFSADPAIFSLIGHGELRLDHSLQPAGTADLSVDGWQDVVDSLTEDGRLSKETANEIRVAFRRRPLMNAGETDAGISLMLRDGMLSSGSIPLLRVPALTWPEPGSILSKPAGTWPPKG